MLGAALALLLSVDGGSMTVLPYDGHLEAGPVRACSISSARRG
jgi:hypothetical protein